MVLREEISHGVPLGGHYDSPTDRAVLMAGYGLKLQHASSIDQVPEGEWNACLGDRGAFTADGLRFLERLFGPHQPRENHWVFHYYRVVDGRGRLVLLTFFTEALWKDDMFAPAEESAAIERLRRHDPYHATSKVFAMGSLLTEGNHLYLDRTADWKAALELLLGDVRRRAASCRARAIVLRDVPAGDTALVEFSRLQSFAERSMPDSMVFEMRLWNTEEEFLAPLRRQRRSDLRKKVFPWNRCYSTRVLVDCEGSTSEHEFDRFRALYQSVKERSLSLNTFPLPPETFRQMTRAPGWELLLLEFRPQLRRNESPQLAAVLACFRGLDHYVPVVMGLDYRYVFRCAAYRQSLWRVICRAKELGKARVLFGLGAPVEKARFGCVSHESLIFHSHVGP